jgi:hypothetical protein
MRSEFSRVASTFLNIFTGGKSQRITRSVILRARAITSRLWLAKETEQSSAGSLLARCSFDALPIWKESQRERVSLWPPKL